METKTAHAEEVQDAGCLRWLFRFLLVPLNTVDALWCLVALTTVPQGSWDYSALAGIEAACLIGILGSIAILLLTWPMLRVMNRWWLAPPAITCALYLGKLWYILHRFPVDSSTP
jgi:hypothetical protein